MSLSTRDRSPEMMVVDVPDMFPALMMPLPSTAKRDSTVTSARAAVMASREPPNRATVALIADFPTIEEPLSLATCDTALDSDHSPRPQWTQEWRPLQFIIDPLVLIH